MALEHGSEVEKFDEYADRYEQEHAKSVGLSGESPEYFAEHKLSCLARLGISPTAHVLDFGCGTGNLTHLLANRYAEVSGYDPSARSLLRARERTPRAHFHASEATLPEAGFDVAVLSGVLHHVPPGERPALVERVARKLKAGGRLVVFEHNPYNPLTLRAVKTCPFDDDAILLRPREVRDLLEGAKLGSVRQDFVLFFPHLLARLRPLERWLRACPLGAQTLTHALRW